MYLSHLCSGRRTFTAETVYLRPLHDTDVSWELFVFMSLLVLSDLYLPLFVKNPAFRCSHIIVLFTTTFRKKCVCSWHSVPTIALGNGRVLRICSVDRFAGVIGLERLDFDNLRWVHLPKSSFVYLFLLQLVLGRSMSAADRICLRLSFRKDAAWEPVVWTDLLVLSKFHAPLLLNAKLARMSKSLWAIGEML